MKNNYIKSPLNYIGGKYKLLPQILPIFPKNINKFIDLFCGGGNVSVNVDAKEIIAVDILGEVIQFLNKCVELDSGDMINNINIIIDKYKLTKINKEGYLQLRQNYNDGNRAWYMFYSLVCYSFNNQIRFNSKREFNLPFGKNRSSFNPSLQKKFIKFVDSLKDINIKFIHSDFTNINIDELDKDDFIYCDPPYLITCATYNENNRWSDKDEINLLDFLDKIHSKNIKFALSNVISSKGKTNIILEKWSSKFNVHEIKAKYGNSNYQRKDKDDISTQEVLITNY